MSTSTIDRPARRPIHVCSLSMSALKVVDQALEECNLTLESMAPEDRFKARGQIFELNRLRWTQLAMQANQHKQLQYIYQHQGDKGYSPKFRQIKMKPLFKFWRQQLMRENWLQLQKAIYGKSVDKRIQNKSSHFIRQRSHLAAKAFKESINLYTVPNIDLISLSPSLAFLNSFQTPRSVGIGFENIENRFAASEAIKDFSTSTFEDMSSDTDETFEARYRQEFIEKARGPRAPVRIQSRGIAKNDLDSESDDDNEDHGIFIVPPQNIRSNTKVRPKIETMPVRQDDRENVYVVDPSHIRPNKGKNRPRIDVDPIIEGDRENVYVVDPSHVKANKGKIRPQIDIDPIREGDRENVYVVPASRIKPNQKTTILAEKQKKLDMMKEQAKKNSPDNKTMKFIIGGVAALVIAILIYILYSKYAGATPTPPPTKCKPRK